MAFDWSNLIDLVGAGAGAYGAYSTYQNAGDQQDAQNRALNAARSTILGGFNGGYGAGAQYGPGASMAPQGAGFNLNYDPFSQQIATGAGGYAAGMAGGLGTKLDPSQLGISGPMGLDAIMSRSGNAGDQAYQQMLGSMRNGFQRPLQNTAFMGAGQQLQDAMMGGDAARMRTLDLLRQQAQPFENRAMNDLQNRQFSMGQLGTSGGGLQTEAFARGLGQADLQRQLDASQEGRNFQNNAMGLATGAAGMGSGLASQEDQLLQSAFGRFSTMQGMNADLNEARFGRSMYAPEQLRQMQLGNINSALGINSTLQGQGLNMFNAGLSASQAGANARLGGSQVAGNIVGSNNFGAGGAMQGNIISQLGSYLTQGRDGYQMIRSLFGGGGSAAAPTGGSFAGYGDIGGGMAANPTSAGLSASAGSVGGLGSLVAGSQAGIGSGIAGTTAATGAELGGMAMPTASFGGVSAAGSGAALGGGASADAAGAAAGGMSGAGMAAGMAALLPIALGVAGMYTNNSHGRMVDAVRDSGLEGVTLSGGQRAFMLPNGSMVANTDQLKAGILKRWGVVPTDQFYQWLNEQPKLQGSIQRLAGRQMPGQRRSVM